MIEALRLSPDDWQLWRRLRLAALGEASYAFGSVLAEWTGRGDTEQRWRDRLSTVPFNVVVVRDGQPAGMASATDPGDDGAVELISLFVAPAFRGHGVGDAAIREVLAWANAQHPRCSVVLSVKANNQAAIELFQRNGFTDAGPSPDGPDERRMRR